MSDPIKPNYIAGEWLAGQEADDRVDQAMDELRRRGLER